MKFIQFKRTDQGPVHINGEDVERVWSLRLLKDDLSWSRHASTVIGKTQQWLHFPRKLKKARLQEAAGKLRHCNGCTPLLDGACNRKFQKELRVIKVAEKKSPRPNCRQLMRAFMITLHTTPSNFSPQAGERGH